MGVEKRRSTLSVLFYIKRQTLLKNGEAPVCMRITVDKRKAEIVNYIRSYCRIEDSGINIRYGSQKFLKDGIEFCTTRSRSYDWCFPCVCQNSFVLFDGKSV